MVFSDVGRNRDKKRILCIPQIIKTLGLEKLSIYTDMITFTIITEDMMSHTDPSGYLTVHTSTNCDKIFMTVPSHQKAFVFKYKTFNIFDPMYCYNGHHRSFGLGRM